MPDNDKVRLSLDVSKQLNATLDEIAAALGITKAEALRRAITLMELAVEGKERGQRVALADKDDRVVTKIAI
jgi:hypothetical protein